MKYIVILLLIPFLAFSQIKGASPIATKTDSILIGMTYAVVIGISDYQDAGIPDLRYADKDAEAFANFLRSPAGGSLDADHLQLLTNTQATAGRIAEALDALIEKAKKDDQVIIYFSGHGDVEGKKLTQPGFLLCWDSPSRVYMGGGTYSLSFLQEVVSTLSVQNQAKVIVITDACHAGKLAGSQIGGAQLTTANLAKQYANEVKILSCQPNEFSLEGPQWGGGRGVFSYHLVDGLFGLADRNNDGKITLGELDRYLEDNVTGEAAPQSQVPILLGNKTDRMATTNASILADLKKNRAGNLAVFEATESRGFEEEILGKVDSSVRNTYQNFKLAVKEKRFFPTPLDTLTGDSAEDYYIQLEKVEMLAPLRGIMKRNYAAALQDDAQQAMNIWLAADVQQLQCIGKRIKLESIPRQLEKASELLGEEHYMYRSLQARKFLFQGINLLHHVNPDEVLARKCLPLFEKALELEPQSPLPLHRMSMIYMNHLRKADSALICARAARNLAPNWVLPFSDLSGIFCAQKKLELAKQALRVAETIDSLHPNVINQWALLNRLLGNREQALALMNKYKESGGPVYPCWFNDYGMIFLECGKYKEAEEEFQKALAMDSTNSSVMNNLGSLYNQTRRFTEAEPIFKKVISIDSTQIVTWNNLGSLYNQTRRFEEAEPIFKKTLSLDSSQYKAWNNLGFLYIQTQRYAEAEPTLLKAIKLDSTYTFSWNNLGGLYIITHRYTEAEPILKKAIALDSAFANAYKHLGMVCFKTKRPEEARQHFEKAIALNPNYAGAMLNMAYVLTSEGKTTEALSYVEQAIGKGITLEQLEKDEDLLTLRALPEWKVRMKKYFLDNHIK